MSAALYRLATGMTEPFIGLYLERRRAAGKEDGARIGERRGWTSRARPAGGLVWFHAASVGESVSVLPLIEQLRTSHPDCHVLVTTVTVTAAAVMAKRLPDGAFHHYAPVDTPLAVRRFLDHWRPDGAVWVESELWPNLVLQTHARDIPMALVNARLSNRSMRRWQRAPRLIRDMLECFTLILAQSEQDATRFSALGGPTVGTSGNLKYDAPPLAADAADVATLSVAIGERPVWLAASTHPGEEAIAGQVHRMLAASHPGLLTIIAPRHPQRGEAITASLEGLGLRVVRRSRSGFPGEPTEIYLADTLGELGLLYRTSPIVFVGGSLVPHGGQNPLEPARLDCALIHGPSMDNFRPIVERFDEVGASQAVAGADALAEAVAGLLDDSALRERHAMAARDAAETLGGALDAVWRRLEPVIADALKETARADA